MISTLAPTARRHEYLSLISATDRYSSTITRWHEYSPEAPHGGKVKNRERERTGVIMTSTLAPTLGGMSTYHYKHI